MWGNDFTVLETLKFENPTFQHILMYYSYLAYVWILEISIFSDLYTLHKGEITGVTVS